MKEKILTLVIAALVALLPVWLIAAVQDDDPSTLTLTLEDAATTTSGDGILRFNFRDAPLDTVLDYMSRAAGFAIVRETDVSGRVDIVSHQSISKDEAVNLLNTVLNEKGYAAIRNGRILTIVSRDEALKRNIPVKTGRIPENIPRTDEMVTQIIPVRYSNAVKMIDNLKTMLPSYAVITANESSNAIVLTDTQAHIRRMAEIISALDTSISQISTLKVFMLQHSDATDVAKMLNELFKTPTTGQQNAGNRFPNFGRMRNPGGDNSGDTQQNTQSEALQAASRVVAVADENTNAVVVSAPEDLMPAIEQLIKDVDATSQGITVVRVFPLKYAYAKDMVDIIKNIFNANSTTQSQNSRFGFMRNFGPGGGQNQQTQQSDRKKAENTVSVQADERTNSLVVSAAEDVMPMVENVVKQLDANPAREKKVFVYPLKNADAQAVSKLLGQFYTQQSSQTSTTNRTTTNRTTGTNTTNRSTGSSSSSSRSGSSSSSTGR
jgi:general secretion pathway protein D